MTVNGLKLPDAFVALIDRPEPLSYWTPKGDNEAWTYKGGEGGLYWIPKDDPDSGDWLADLELFKSLAEVEEKTNRLSVTLHLSEYTPEEIAEWDARYAKRRGWIPFITDFSKIVCCGQTDLGEAYCFDYRW